MQTNNAQQAEAENQITADRERKITETRHIDRTERDIGEGESARTAQRHRAHSHRASLSINILQAIDTISRAQRRDWPHRGDYAPLAIEEHDLHRSRNRVADHIEHTQRHTHNQAVGRDTRQQFCTLRSAAPENCTGMIRPNPDPLPTP